MDDPELLKKVYIRDVTEKDFSGIQKLCDQVLGKDYLSLSVLENAFEEKNAFLKIAIFDEEICGFCYGYISNLETQYSKSNLDLLLNAFPNTDSIGVIKTVATSQTLQQRGIGTKIVSECLDFFDKHGTKYAYSVAWKRQGVINIERLLKRFNFQPLREIPDFWAMDSIENDYSCPQCGLPPCRCHAIIFVKK